MAMKDFEEDPNLRFISCFLAHSDQPSRNETPLSQGRQSIFNTAGAERGAPLEEEPCGSLTSTTRECHPLASSSSPFGGVLQEHLNPVSPRLRGGFITSSPQSPETSHRKTSDLFSMLVEKDTPNNSPHQLVELQKRNSSVSPSVQSIVLHHPVPESSFSSHAISQSQSVNMNCFDCAHFESFGISPPKAPAKISDPGSSDFSDDDDDSFDESDTCSSLESWGSTGDPLIDTTLMSSQEILKHIRKPSLSPFLPKTEDLRNHLSEYEVGHLNYLIKCYSDALFAISIPPHILEPGTSVNYMNLHMLGVFHIYYLMFKSEDFRQFKTEDQARLLQNNMVSILISLGFTFYEVNSKGWVIPQVSSNASSVLSVHSLSQLVPTPVTEEITLLCEVAKDTLHIDEVISILFVFIIVYTPVGTPIVDINIMDRIRDKYVNVLHHYLQWKLGTRNAALLLPEILKLLDALLKFNTEINKVKLDLSGYEVSLLNENLQFIESKLNTMCPNRSFSEKISDTVFLSDYPECLAVHSLLSQIFLKLGDMGEGS